MKNLIVAGSRRHGEAMIRWMGFDPSAWDVVAYGEDVDRPYWSVRLVRPCAGVEDAHVDWLSKVLEPRIRGDINTISEAWRL